MITIKEVKQADVLKVHVESKKGYLVNNYRQKAFDLSKIDDIEIVSFILENAEQVRYESDITYDIADIFIYSIDNGYSYECNMHTELYSKLYLPRSIFENMCRTAQEKIKKSKDKRTRVNDIYTVAKTLEDIFPDVFIQTAYQSVVVPQNLSDKNEC